MRRRAQNTYEKCSQGAILSNFQGLAGGTPRRTQNNDEKGSQDAILNHFQGLAGGDTRKKTKQPRNKFSGSHSALFSGPGWEDSNKSPKPEELLWFAGTLVIECNVQNNQVLNENHMNSRRLDAVTLHKAQNELAAYLLETQEFPLSGCNHVVECRT
jgi:hypothetical protein